MGRPLKIAKYNGATPVDEGFPNDGTTDNGYTTNQPGVVGGVEDVAVYGNVCVDQAWYGTYYASTASAVVSSIGAGTLNSNELGTTQIYSNGVYVGTVSSVNTAISMTTVSSAASTDRVTVDDTTGLVVDGSIVFGADIGGLTAGTVYFVKGIPSGTTLTVSATPGGALIQLSDDTVATSADQAETITLADPAEIALSGATITCATPDSGYIVRQKGKKKYLVARRETIQDEFIATGGTYLITSAGDTDWSALGAGPDATADKIFTATANGLGLGTTGSVYVLGVCTLVDEDQGNLVAGQASFIIDRAVASDTNASTITNKFVLDFTDNGTDENAGTKYIASFDAKTATPDPATGLETIDMDYYC